MLKHLLKIKVLLFLILLLTWEVSLAYDPMKQTALRNGTTLDFGYSFQWIDSNVPDNLLMLTKERTASLNAALRHVIRSKFSVSISFQHLSTVFSSVDRIHGTTLYQEQLIHPISSSLGISYLFSENWLLDLSSSIPFTNNNTLKTAGISFFYINDPLITKASFRKAWQQDRSISSLGGSIIFILTSLFSTGHRIVLSYTDSDPIQLLHGLDFIIALNPNNMLRLSAELTTENHQVFPKLTCLWSRIITD